MTAANTAIPTASPEAIETSEPPPSASLLARGGRMALKAFLVASGLALGCFVGLVIAVLAGLVGFAC